MYCKSCGKEISTGARFCMFCGTPVESIPASVAEPEPPVPSYKTAPVIDEPAPARRERRVFEEINWNVSEYPDSNDVIHKTEDVDFNWNANPADIPDPVSRRGAQPRVEEDPYNFGDIFDKKSSSPSLEDELFSQSRVAAEEMSAAERIDKFYTFNKKNEEFQQLLNREYSKVKSGNPIGAEMSRADELAEERFAARATRPATMEDFLEAEGVVKPYQPKAFESDVLKRIEQQEAEREAKRLEDEARRAAMEEARLEAERAKLAKLEEQRLAAEAAKAKAEAEAREAARLAEETRLKAEAEAKARAEAQARADEIARREAAEAKARAEEEARKVAEEEARIKAQAVANYQAAEEARIKAEEELKAAQEAAKIKAQQEARKAAEAQARFEGEQEKRRLADIEARMKLEAQRKKLEREANESIAAQEARKVLEQTARIKEVEAAKIKEAVASLRSGSASVAPRQDVEEAHQATRDQINEMAKARNTFFGGFSIAEEFAKDEANFEPVEPVQVVYEPEPEPVVYEPEPEPVVYQPEPAQVVYQPEPEPVIYQPEPMAPVEEPFEETSFEDFMTSDFEDMYDEVTATAPAQVTGRDTMLHQDLSSTRVVDKAAIMAGVSDATIQAGQDTFTAPAAASTAPAYMSEAVDDIDDLLSQLETVEETVDEDLARSEYDAMLSQMKMYDDDMDELAGFDDLDDFDDFGTDAGQTIVIGQTPREIAEAPAMDFDSDGEPEPDLAATRVIGDLPAEPEPVAVRKKRPAPAPVYYDDLEELTLSKKERKKVAKAKAAEEKAAAKAAKKDKKAAKKGKKAAKKAGNYVDDDYFDFDDVREDGGKGSIILKIVLVLLCLVLAAEIVGIGIHFIAPQSRIAELVDTQLNTILHQITGDEETEYNVFGQERRTTPLEDKTTLIDAKLSNNYKHAIGNISYNADLKYKPSDGDKISDLVLSMPITEVEWGRDADNYSVYYDEEVVGTVIAYESERYEWMNNGDDKVMSIVNKDSGLYSTLKNKKNVGSGTFERLEIGEIRNGGTSYYVWVKEVMSDKTTTKVLKMNIGEGYTMLMNMAYTL